MVLLVKKCHQILSPSSVLIIYKKKILNNVEHIHCLCHCCKRFAERISSLNEPLLSHPIR
jgi:hypothetical protein